MTYKESKKKLDELRRKDEVMFRMAISHLMDVGFRHLTEEDIEITCKAIMQEDDTKHFMTNEFKCELIRVAGELAKIDHIYLLVYISREVYYDVGDNKVSYHRAIELVEDCMTWISYDMEYSKAYATFSDIGFSDEELEEFGCEFLLDNEEDE